ncbi:TRAP transporter small permease [Pseudomaricurvus alcaniphilus]|uniref:TRAP transporter small permease n=1 Tax=Pseudomaricurvus alcaniphilus TaxID=1166482 RepID=UPI00140A1A18|nr:TRAP transporter small permease [Pseudomaricurvus alcaniphilus]NHN35783.1 TRAP transporter small permease [Pseudomaricurvus alcaniphilus]
MPFTLENLAKLTHRLTRWALYISAAGLVLMSLIIGWQVFGRYVLNASPAWSEPVALLLMLYYIMLAAAVGVYEGFHLGLRIVIDNLPPLPRCILSVINDGLVGFFGLQMFIHGTKLAGFTVDHVIPTLGISRAAAYWPFAAAGLLILIFSIERILITLTNKNEKPTWNS